jgi:hypothetical protein
LVSQIENNIVLHRKLNGRTHTGSKHLQ